MDQLAVLSVRHGQFWYDEQRGRPVAWTWTLERPGEARVLTKTVRLDRSPGDRRTMADLYELPLRIRRLRERHPGAVDLVEDELRRVGAWLGEMGLGPLTEALADTGAVAMRLPPELAEFEALPWELAMVRGDGPGQVRDKPLALHRTTLVRGVRPSLHPAPPVTARATTGEQVRVLALFSLARGTLPLNLSTHREALRAAVLAGTADREVPAHLSTVQFGAGPTALNEAMGEGGDWDVIHIVCHGLPGGLLLERDEPPERTAGEPERGSAAASASFVGAAEIGRLLAAARGRLKLLCLTACWSGGEDPSAHADRPLTSLAATLADQLGCAVVAMRFPVGNDFAACFDAALYQGLLGKGWPLPEALRHALRTATRDPGLAERQMPLLSACTPVLFGTTAPYLRIGQGSSPFEPVALPLAAMGGPLPDPPRPFVDREEAMRAVRAATAPGSAVPGAVLHGEELIGTTSCAAVLAHRHQQEISPVLWHPRPDWAPPIDDPAPAPAPTPTPDARSVDAFLTHLAYRLPACENALAAARERDWPAPVEAVVAGLSGRSDLLLVIDRVDRMLRRDPRWRELLDALAAAADTPRLLLTSRTELPGCAPALTRVPLGPLTPARLQPLLTVATPRLVALLDADDELAHEAFEIAAGNPGMLLAAGRAAARRQDLEIWVRTHSAD
ncbi:CHAT domain-containing protein [Streptomyces sp. NPDC002328]|uniref:CHAT domain-containing protein n=1 Tax=Streptomyces sp. NPDC002328 TaxID=3364642 RepID=UPI003688603A